MGVGKPLHLRLFLEGIEVPVVSAVVSVNFDAPASASVQIVPIEEGMFFKPRTMVHLFFLEEPLLKAGESVRTSLAAGLDTELADSSYKLLFSGEVVGISWQKQPMSRCLILQCLDFSSYWDTLHLTMLNYGPQGNAFVNQGAVYAANSYLFSNIPTQSPEEQLAHWIKGTPKTPGLGKVKGLAKGILNTMETVGGLAGATAGVNDFFTIAELRCHLMAQITADEDDSTSQRLLENSVFWKWIFNDIQVSGGQATLRDLLKILNRFIYYSVVPNPTAKIDTSLGQMTRLRSQFFRPDSFMCAPPACNVVFPEQYSALSYDRIFFNEVTRVAVLQHNVFAQDDLLSKTFMAPHLGSWTSTKKDTTKQMSQNLKNQFRVLMPHELHTGIIPVIERIPDSMAGLRKSKGTEAALMRGLDVEWPKLVAMYHFFKHRIGARHTSVAGRFMPYLAAGFPGLVIQRPFMFSNPNGFPDRQVLDMIQNAAFGDPTLGAPQQILGLVDGYQHEISQDGGRTSFSMSHCRLHLGIDDDFIGMVGKITKTPSGRKIRMKYLLRLDDIKEDQSLLSFLVNLTPQNEEVSTSSSQSTLTSQEVTYQIQSKNGDVGSETLKHTVRTDRVSSEQQTSSFTSVLAVPWAEKKSINVPKGICAKGPGSAGRYGTIFNIDVINPVRYDMNGKWAFGAVFVYEDVDATSQVDIPVEDLIRPSWLSTSYDNASIGASIYQQFLGCDSILEQINVQDGTVDANGKPSTVSSLTVPPKVSSEGVQVSATMSRAEALTQAQDVIKHRSLLSIEKAVNTIGFLYGHVRAKHKDADAFITSLTRRPIATKKDMLGSHDLIYTVGPNEKIQVQGTEGFHSRSVAGPLVKHGKLLGLLDPPSKVLTKMNGATREALKTDYDVRNAKREAVQAYSNKLRVKIGLAG